MTIIHCIDKHTAMQWRTMSTQSHDQHFAPPFKNPGYTTASFVAIRQCYCYNYKKINIHFYNTWLIEYSNQRSKHNRRLSRANTSRWEC